MQVGDVLSSASELDVKRLSKLPQGSRLEDEHRNVWQVSLFDWELVLEGEPHDRRPKESRTFTIVRLGYEDEGPTAA